MPLYLRPLSRRKFIARALAAGALLGLSPSMLAARVTRDKHTWALLSDTHIAADLTRTARGVNMAENLGAPLRELLALAPRPAGMLLAGDCAFNTGESGDYARLAELLLPLRTARLPMHLLLGNHDNRERFWAAFPKARKAAVPDKQATVVKAEHVNFFLLDSLESTNSTPGLLGEQQLAWLSTALDERSRTPAVVVVHHNLGAGPPENGLKDTDALMNVLRPRQPVKALIYGHTHRWEISQDPSGIHLINLPPVAYVFKEGDPSGWVLARTRKSGLDLELRCLDKSHKLHGQKVELAWRTGSRTARPAS